MDIKRYAALLIFLSVLLIILSVFSLKFGTIYITNKELTNYLLNFTTGNHILDNILFKLRMPRTVGAIVSGVAISIAGILMQSYFRNPLADPYLMGVASGASLGVVLYVFTSLLFNVGIPHNIYGFILSAYLGAFLSMFVVVTIAKTVKQPATLLICGLMIGSITYGLTTIIIYTGNYIGGMDESKLTGYLLWNMGSMNNLTWEQVMLMGMLILPLFVVTYIMLSKKMDANLLGEMYAISMGIDIKNLKKLLIILSSVLTATVVAFTGPIAFIGIICPIIARMICKTSKHLYIMPITALLGAIFLVSADILTRPGIIISKSSNVLPLLCPLSIIGAPIAITIYLKIRKMGL